MSTLHKLSAILSVILTRRVCARLLSTFICSVIIVIRPFSRFGGDYTFLVLTLKELVFGVQKNIAQQVEATVLNLGGALVAISISTSSRYLASLLPDDSARARTIPAVFLILICFVAGYCKSRLPRLTLSARISCLVATWILTTDAGETEGKFELSTNFIWIVLCPAIICLLSGMLFLTWYSTSFAREVASGMSQLHDSLSLALDEGLGHESADGSLKYGPGGHRPILDAVLKRSVMLNVAYSQAAFELRVGRLSVKSIRPFISIIEHLRREMSSLSGALTGCVQSQTITTFRHPALNLGHAILDAMKIAEKSVVACFEHSVLHTVSLSSEMDSIADAQAQLIKARDGVRENLKRHLDDIDISHRSVPGGMNLSKELSDSCSFMISLLQMAHELRHALIIAHKMTTIYDKSRTRLWYPRLTWAWLGLPPSMVINDEDTIPEEVQHRHVDPESALSLAEARQGIAERAYPGIDPHKIPVTEVPYKNKPGFHILHLGSWISGFWAARKVLRARLALSKFLRVIQHSSHIKHATKNAVGVALLSLPAFLPVGSPGQRWFTYIHGQWAIISYVWVLETNTGATFHVGYLRISGTIIGAVYAYVTWLICHTNPYALVLFVTAADLPFSWIIVNTAIPSLGVVANITLPPIVFARYLSLSSSTPVIVLAALRALTIGVGIVVALLVNTLVYPRHCRVLYLSDSSRTLNLLSQLYLTLGRDLFQRHYYLTPDNRQTALRLEQEIRSALYRLSLLLNAMNDELSLIPKPMRQYRKTLTQLQTMLDLMTGLRKVRENIPVKETISTVFSERRDFVSCICLSLHACEFSFRCRRPLPQYLPSSRHALKTLVGHIEDSINEARARDPRALGLPIIYSLAEIEFLKNIVDTMETLLDVSRALFGTAAWLTEEPTWRTISVNDTEDSHRGWYSTL